MKTITFKWLVPIICLTILILWLVETPPGLLGKADAVGYAVCHRISVRSFFLDDRPLPLCARCTGMYLGAMAGLLYQFFGFPRRGGMLTWKTGLPFVIFALAWLFDGANSFFHLIPGIPGIYQPNNTLRLITGLGMGLAMAVILYPAFQQTIWRRYDPRPVFQSPKPYFMLILLAVITGILTLTGNPMILYPFALISAIGVIVILTMVYTLVWIMVFRKENSFDHVSELLIPISAGFLTTLIQIGGVDMLRFWLTGTWAGFHF